MKRMFRLAAFAAVGLLVSSCMDLTTEIHVKKDGSATVSQAIYMTSALAAMQQLGDSKSLIDETQLKAKAAQMGKGVTYLGAKEMVRQDGSKGYVARYGVKNIDDLTLNGSEMFTLPGENQSPSESADDEPLWKFRFTPGKEASLAIEMAADDGGQAAEERDGAYEQGGGQADADNGEQAAEDAMATEIIKLMLKEMRMWIHVRFDETITETNAQYVNPKKSGLTLLKIDFGKLVADEKAFAQLQALGKQPKPGDVRTRFARLQDDLPYLQIEDQKVVQVKFEFASSKTAVQRMQPSCQEWNTEEFFRNATGADVQYCLDMGMNVNARDYVSSPTPLHLAAQFGTPASIRTLIDAGANIEATADYGESGGAYNSPGGFTPLHAAAVWGTPANMRALIDAGTNVHGDVLDWVAARGTPGNLKVLIDAGADVRGALYPAVYGGPAKIALLLEAGADIEARDAVGRTPLHVAADIEFWEPDIAGASIKALVDGDADVKARDQRGRTPLHLAAAESGGPASIEALLEAGADIEARDAVGRTPLHVAASMPWYSGLEAGDPGSLTALLDAGANIEARDQDGRTPLHVAALHLAFAVDGLLVPVEALLDAGADIEARDKDGSSALHLAAGVEYGEWGASNNITTLIDAGASIEAKDNDGRTPLHVAAGMGDLPGHPDNVTLFLEAGADAGARDNDELSQFKFAPASHAEDYTRWNLPEGALARLGKGAIGESDRAVAYSPDGTRLAVGSGIGIWLYDARTGTEFALLTGHTSGVYSVSFSPNGRTLASGSYDGTVLLWEVASGQKKAILEGHTDGVRSVSFSPDGRTLASGSVDNTVRLWDVESGQLKATLEGHTDGVRSIAFSPDGQTLASVSDTVIILWDVESGQEQATLRGHTGLVLSASFSPDGRTLASGSVDNTVRLWDVESGQEQATLRGHTGWVTSVSFSPDGQTLASGNEDATIRLWDVASGESKATLTHRGGLLNWVRSVAFSPDGQTLASGSHRRVWLWDVASGQKKAVLEGHTGWVTSVSFSPDGQTLASGNEDATIRLWDVASGQHKATLEHPKALTSMRYSPDSQTLASGHWDHRVRLWDGASGQHKATLKPLLNSSEITSVSFSPDGQTLAAGGHGYNAWLWDVASGGEKATLEDHGYGETWVLFSPDGQTLASWDQEGVRLWDGVSGEEQATLQGHTGWVLSVRSVSFSPDGQTLASGSGDATIRLWDVASGQEKAILRGHTGWSESVSFSPDGQTLASGSRDETVRLWDVASGQEQATLRGHTSGVYSVSFSPDGQTLASGSGDATIQLWDVASGQEKAILRGHTSGVYSVSFSPDGQTLASEDGKEIRLWDVASGLEQATLRGHTGGVTSVSFSPDGQTLASGSWDGTILLWDMSPYITRAQTAESVDEGAQIALQPHEYGVWEGEWIRTDSDLEDNYYSILRIQDVDDRGFTYSSECRNVPYGPNAMWSDEERASFRGPFSAANPATGASFSLRVNPDDRHDRVMAMNPVQCSHTDAVPDSVFVFRRPVYRAGFDCDKAATPVETTICHNELLAQGDREMSILYRELLEQLPAIEVETLRSAQRSWLQKRNRECLTGDAVDDVCLARRYSDRLAALTKLQDSSLGAEPHFDAAYALALVIRGSDLRQDTATRLAMYPLVMDPEGTVAWQADDSGLLFEQTWVKTKVVWPADVDFRYSDMLFVGSEGTVWTAAHTETADPMADDIPANERLWLNAGRDPLTVWSETGGEGDYPDLVATWLKEHPVPEENDSLSPADSLAASEAAVAYFEKNIPERGTVYLNQKLGIVEFRKKDWGLSSEDTDHLLSLRNLEILSMGLVKEQDLERLAALLKINTLIFELVPGERLPDLAAFANLRTLKIRGRGLEDADMPQLCSNQSIRVLTLDHTSVSDTGLECLQNMSSLSHLDIESNVLTDKVIPFFSALQKQSNSRFDGSNIRSKGFTEKGYARLRELGLERPPPEENILLDEGP